VSPRYPAALKAAGIVWVVYGGLTLLIVAGNVFLSTVLKSTDMVGTGHMNASSAIFGAMFLFIGYFVVCQSVQFPAFGPLCYGLCSICMSFKNFVHVVDGIALPLTDNDTMILTAGVIYISYFLGGLALVSAGVLAIIARNKYRTWHEWHKAMKTHGRCP
jgi:hypothetical protein